MRVASRMRPEGRGRRGASAVISWDHDGVNVDSFTVEIDGTDYDAELPTPNGTTYTFAWPEAVEAGSHSVAVYAVNEDGRTTSAVQTLEKPA